MVSSHFHIKYYQKYYDPVDRKFLHLYLCRFVFITLETVAGRFAVHIIGEQFFTVQETGLTTCLSNDTKTHA